ncbi:biopolymer transporter ExbD [Nostoc flagelliforme FACHB-838]|uniref:Biopolymer transporter ExbD n=1 Tax=Nostoc flagelliforme FACHB-838 TaxID=2692904 RepID=A0ABR8E0X7_9NOSO|nr:biopolymer transporter ExbD [Nostoc flagelliforme]MBD2535321.1 biopolymer transporter ExbD [Nostoc flagelliforme FACHB-838]
MRLPKEPNIPAQINIVPMIDIVFTLLTFFILSSLFLSNSEALPVNLPKANTAQQSKSVEKIIITINSQGDVSLNRKPTAFNALTEQLRTLVGKNQDVLVVINADEKANMGLAVAVMDKVRKVPGTKLAIATQRP